MIGIFDSGSGGLTVLKEIRARIPSANILYFGDIKNAPYGSRSRQELFDLTGAAITKLSDGGATSIVSACNSVSTSLTLSLLDSLSIAPDHLVEMVGPTVRHFKNSDIRIGLVATVATIESGIYQSAFHMIGKEVEAIAIPELAGAIEHGDDASTIEEIIRTALSGKEDAYDVLVLACTHYPLVTEQFRKVLASTTETYDPAAAVGEQVESMWWPREVGEATLRFVISEDSPVFRRLVENMFPEGGYEIEVVP
ncbi:MAG: aspartate/glutamate racemase family protein [Patescibacteria group bacterium]